MIKDNSIRRKIGQLLYREGRRQPEIAKRSEAIVRQAGQREPTRSNGRDGAA
jgi:hypothetical protein